MTWPDVVRSVEARIHDGQAQDKELRAITDRYSSWDEALEGHNAIVAKLRAALAG